MILFCSRRPLLAIAILSRMLIPVCVHADVLELKDGTLAHGSFVGGTASTVRFQQNGRMEVHATSDIVALTFTAEGNPSGPAATNPAPAPAPAPEPVATPASAPGPRELAIPTGTRLLVRVLDAVSSQSAPGTIFTTRLEHDLVVDGVRVAPAGASVFGKVAQASQARRSVGRSQLELRLYQIVIDGQPVALVTDNFRQAGANSTGAMAKSAAAGATVGKVASDDAGKGAAIGAGLSFLRGGQTVVIKPGTLLEFDLTAPARVDVVR